MAGVYGIVYTGIAGDEIGGRGEGMVWRQARQAGTGRHMKGIWYRKVGGGGGGEEEDI